MLSGRHLKALFSKVARTIRQKHVLATICICWCVNETQLSYKASVESRSSVPCSLREERPETDKVYDVSWPEYCV